MRRADRVVLYTRREKELTGIPEKSKSRGSTPTSAGRNQTCGVMPEISSQSQSIFAARVAGLWVCPKVGQIEVTENPCTLPSSYG